MNREAKGTNRPFTDGKTANTPVSKVVESNQKKDRAESKNQSREILLEKMKTSANESALDLIQITEIIGALLDEFLNNDQDSVAQQDPSEVDLEHQTEVLTLIRTMPENTHINDILLSPVTVRNGQVFIPSPLQVRFLDEDARVTQVWF